MVPVYVGWLSLIPAVIAIGLALITKEVVFSLVIGIFSGTLIYSAAMGQNLFFGSIMNFINITVQSVDFSVLLLLALLGSLIYLISISGGQYALGKWVMKHVKSKTGVLIASTIASCCIFISPSFHILSVGAVIRPLCDSAKVSRAKLAYILDATAAPTACIAPVSTWIAGIIATFPATTLFSNGLAAFYQSIPWNMYCLASIFMSFWVAFPRHDFGSMVAYERKADAGDLGIAGDESIGQLKEGDIKGGIIDMVLPLALLLVLTFVFILYTGGMWQTTNVITEAMAKTSTTKAMCDATLVTLILTGFFYVVRKIIDFKTFLNSLAMGTISMVNISIIIVLAWSISGVCRKLLLTGDFVSNLIQNSNFTLGFLPVMLFFISCLLSFATGSSWGTFGIVLPLAFSICETVAPELIVIGIAAVLGGSTFGDHCSPISDTTVMASGVADVNHIVHVGTQLPYALTCAFAASAGYLVAGFTANIMLTLIVFISVLLGVSIVWARISNRKSETV